MMEINDKNIEDIIMLFIDNELSNKEEDEFFRFMNENKEYEELLESYIQVKLIPDKDVVFPEKNSLLKNENIIIPFYKKGGFILKIAALFIFGIMGLSYWLTIKTESPMEKLVVANSNWKEKDIVERAVAKEETVKRGFLKEQTTRNEIPQRGNNKQNILEQDRNLTMVIEKIETISSSEIKVEELNISPVLITSNFSNLENVIKLEDMENKKSLLKDPRFQGINDLFNQFQDTKEKVEDNFLALRNSKLIIQIGQKEISF